MDIQRLIEKDRSATLAALMLAALAAERPINSYDDLVNFPDVPETTCKVQDAVLDLLVERNHLSAKDAMFSYVEPGCVEHQVVHVWTPACWLEIDPVTGTIGMI